MKGWIAFPACLPEGKGCWQGKQQRALGCRSRVLLLHPPALLLPARALKAAGNRGWHTSRGAIDLRTAGLGRNIWRKQRSGCLQHGRFGDVFVYHSSRPRSVAGASSAPPCIVSSSGQDCAPSICVCPESSASSFVCEPIPLPSCLCRPPRDRCGVQCRTWTDPQCAGVRFM